ncbi:hypothetical protein HDV05_003440, partial [Chytridiales sp. JEL 0842]
EELFGNGKIYDRATKACLAVIARRVEMVRQIHRIRRLVVGETVVALVGTQDAGKTTAGRILFPHVDREFPRRTKDGHGLIRRGMYEHTAGVRVFPQGRVAVADFPGSDSTAIALDQAMRRFGSVASVGILFCHFNGDASGEVLRNLEEIKDWSTRIPILLCIHQAGNKVNSDASQFLFNDELTSIEDVERFIQRWKRTIESRFPGIVIHTPSSISVANEETSLQKTDSSNLESLMSQATESSKDMQATSPPVVSMENLTQSSQPGITITMTEFAKELKLCKSFGIWGPED